MGQKVNSNIFRLGKTKDWNSKYLEKKSVEQALYTLKDVELKNLVEKNFKDNGLVLSTCKVNYLDNTIYIFISYYLTSQSNFLMSKNLIQKSFKNSNKILKRILFFFNSQNLKKNKLKSKKMYKIKFLKYSNIYIKRKYKNVKNFKINSFIEKFIKSLNYFINKKENKIILTFKQLNQKTKLNFNKKKLGFVQEKSSELRLFEKNIFFTEGLNVFFTFFQNSESAELLAEFIAKQLKLLKKNHNFFLKFIKTALTLLNNKLINSAIDGVKIKIKGKFNKAARAKHRIITIGNVPLFNTISNINYAEKISYSSNGTFGVKVWVYKTL